MSNQVVDLSRLEQIPVRSLDQAIDLFDKRDLQDEIIDARYQEVEFVDMKNAVPLVGLTDKNPYAKNHHRVVYGKHAIGQLFERAWNTSKFWNLFREEPEFVQDGMNILLKHMESDKHRSKMLAREIRPPGQDHYLTRAILSSQYGKLNHEDVLRGLYPYYEKGLLGDVNPAGSYVGWNDMFLNLEVPQFARPVEMRPGDDISLGVEVFNGETGNRSVGLIHWVEREVCSNGMRGRVPGEKTEFQHRGGFVAQKIDHAIQMTVNALARVPETLSRNYDRRVTAPEGKIETVYASLTKALRTGQKDSLKFAQAFREDELGPDSSVMGIVNGITRVARDEPRLEKRVKYEELAGKIVQATDKQLEGWFGAKVVDLRNLSPGDISLAGSGA